MQNIRHPLRTVRRHIAGFTLIELLIAVAIVGILVKLAYPAYNQSVLKSHRADAKTALLDLATREEKYYTTNNTYTASAPALGYATGTTLTAASPLPVLTGATAYYNLSIQVPDPAVPSAPSFIATATATSPIQTNDAKCKNFTLTQAGVQGVTSSTDTAANCW